MVIQLVKQNSATIPRKSRASLLPPHMATYLEQSTAQTTVFETAVPWMYLDTRGLVTAGIGQMLPDAASAQSLAFLHPDGTPATPDAIHADFDRVHALAAGEPCHAYRSPSSPTLA